MRHLVTTSESLSISVATASDLEAIEPAWWRLLNHQQTLDFRGSERELSTQINTEIADVWVEPHARRRGFATAMVRECEQECRMRGADEVRLSVYALNDGALGLYESLGYDVSSYTLSRNLNPYR